MPARSLLVSLLSIAALLCQCACSAPTVAEARSQVGEERQRPDAPVESSVEPSPTYARLRIGVFDPRGDIASLESGVHVDATLGRRLTRNLAVEGQLGWFQAEGTDGFQLDGVPAFVNGRVGVPLGPVEPYAGLGAGGILANYTGGSDAVLAWQGFAGVAAHLDRVVLGVEVRYVQSDRTEAGFDLESQSLMLTGGVRF